MAIRNVQGGSPSLYRSAYGLIDFTLPGGYVTGSGLTLHITVQDVVTDPGSPSFVQAWAATKLDLTSFLTIPLAGPFVSADLWTVAPGQTIVLFCGQTTAPTFDIVGESVQTGTVTIPGANSNAFNWTETVGANPYPISQGGGAVVVNGDNVGLSPPPAYTHAQGALQLDDGGSPATSLAWITSKALKFGAVGVSNGPTHGTIEYAAGDTITLIIERGPTSVTASPGNQTTITQIQVETSGSVLTTLDLTAMKVAQPQPALVGLIQAIGSSETPDGASQYPWVLTTFSPSAPSPTLARIHLLMSVNQTITLKTAATRAYRLLGNLEPPWVPSDDQMTQALLAANMLQRTFETDGINLWRQEQRSITVPAMAQSVEITPYVLGVQQASWVVTPGPNLYKRPLGYYSYVDYWNLPNPLAQSTSGPSVYMFDKQDVTSTLWIWPVPTNGGTIIASVGRAVNDITDIEQTLDIPGEWAEGYVYNLADRLMDDQAVASADPQTAERITQRAVLFYNKLKDFDRPTSVFMRPWGKAGQSRNYR